MENLIKKRFTVPVIKIGTYYRNSKVLKREKALFHFENQVETPSFFSCDTSEVDIALGIIVFKP